jgi:transposase
MTLLNYFGNNPVKHTANFIKKIISVFTKIQYVSGQEDHCQAQLLQKCTKEGRTNIE